MSGSYDISKIIIEAGIEPLVEKFAWDSGLIVTGQPGTLEWSVWPYADIGVWAKEVDTAIAQLTQLVDGAAGDRAVTDDQLSAALHRTVPTQLAILADARDALANEKSYPVYRRGLELARQLTGVAGA